MSGRGKEVAFDQLVRVLDRVPLVSSVRHDLKGLQSLLLHRRAPRIAALGLGGSGRSSLLRALIERRSVRRPLHAEHGQWVEIEHEGARVDWLEIDVAKDAARTEWKTALEKQVPDLVFVALEPNNLDDARRIVDRVKSLLPDTPEGTAPLRTFVLLTHADLIGDGPSDVEAARARVEADVSAARLETDPPMAATPS